MDCIEIGVQKKRKQNKIKTTIFQGQENLLSKNVRVLFACFVQVLAYLAVRKQTEVRHADLDHDHASEV